MANAVIVMIALLRHDTESKHKAGEETSCPEQVLTVSRPCCVPLPICTSKVSAGHRRDRRLPDREDHAAHRFLHDLRCAFVLAYVYRMVINALVVPE